MQKAEKHPRRWTWISSDASEAKPRTQEPCASSSLLRSLGRLLQGRQLSAEGLGWAKVDLACRNERSRHSGRCHGSQTTIPRVSKRLGSGLLRGGETRIRRRESGYGTSLHTRPSTRFCPPNQAARDIVTMSRLPTKAITWMRKNIRKGIGLMIQN